MVENRRTDPHTGASVPSVDEYTEALGQVWLTRPQRAMLTAFSLADAEGVTEARMAKVGGYNSQTSAKRYLANIKGGAILGHSSAGILAVRAAQKSSTFCLNCLSREGWRIYTVEVYLPVRRAHFDEGRSKRSIARDFGLARGTVDKMCAFAVPPCHRREKDVRRPRLDGFTVSNVSACGTDLRF